MTLCLKSIVSVKPSFGRTNIDQYVITIKGGSECTTHAYPEGFLVLHQRLKEEIKAQDWATYKK